MSDDGKQLLAFVKEIRSLCRQAADLLLLVDEAIFERGWELATSQNIAFANISTSLNLPDQWFPFEVFRFYANEQQPTRLLFVSILLDDDRRKEYALTEPLATAGWFDFPKGTTAPVVASGSWWWSSFHGYMPDRVDDGSSRTINPKTTWPKEVAERPAQYPFEAATTFAVPLISLTSSELVHRHLIAPLLERGSIARVA